MSTLELNIQEVRDIVEFCDRNNVKYYTIGTDLGAYVGAESAGNQCYFYFEGCKPTDTNWYYEVTKHFGKEGLFELFDIDHLKRALNTKANWIFMVINMNATGVTIKFR